RSGPGSRLDRRRGGRRAALPRLAAVGARLFCRLVRGGMVSIRRRPVDAETKASSRLSARTATFRGLGHSRARATGAVGAADARTFGNRTQVLRNAGPYRLSRGDQALAGSMQPLLPAAAAPSCRIQQSK